MLRWILILVSVLSYSCPTKQIPDLQVAPLPTVETPKLPETAQEFLEYGFEAFGKAELIPAIWAFQNALETRQLNDRGRAVCYWHIATAYRLMNEKDKAAEALFYFSIIGQDILEENVDTEFIESIGLEFKLEDAESYIETVWREKHERGALR